METKTELTKEQKELLDELYEETDIDVSYDMENNKPETIEELMEMLQERVYEIEVIYYSNAIKYLAEHDQSLTESLSLAKDMGMELDDLNSEKLATLLQQQQASEALPDYEERLKEAFYPEN